MRQVYNTAQIDPHQGHFLLLLWSDKSTPTQTSEVTDQGTSSVCYWYQSSQHKYSQGSSAGQAVDRYADLKEMMGTLLDEPDCNQKQNKHDGMQHHGRDKDNNDIHWCWFDTQYSRISKIGKTIFAQSQLALGIEELKATSIKWLYVTFCP